VAKSYGDHWSGELFPGVLDARESAKRTVAAFIAATDRVTFVSAFEMAEAFKRADPRSTRRGATPGAERAHRFKISIDESFASIELRAPDPYWLTFQRITDGHLACTCSCAAFMRTRKPCVHAVAAILLGMTDFEPWIPAGLQMLSARSTAARPQPIVDVMATPAAWILHPDDVPHLMVHGRVLPPQGREAGIEWGLESGRESATSPARVYILEDRSPQTPSILTCWQPARTAEGAIALSQRPLGQTYARRSNETLDPVDHKVHDRLSTMAPSLLRPSSQSQFVALVIAEIARAGRLHRAYADPAGGPRRLGPPLRWIGDLPWQVEVHVGPVPDPHATVSGEGDRTPPADALALASRNGLRLWLRLVAPNQQPIDCLNQADHFFVHLVQLGDDLLDAAATDELGRFRFNSRCLELMRFGADISDPEDLVESLDRLRYLADRYTDDDSASTDRVVLDPTLGVRLFSPAPDGMPTPVLRLDGSPTRSTVDVIPLSRYVHPDDPTIVVDRDVRTNRLIEDPAEPLMTVPRGILDAEEQIESKSREMVRRAGGSAAARWRLPRAKLPALLRAAAKRGYAVELQKQPARAGGRWSLSVTSGIDWFDLNGQLETPEGAIPLGELVRAARASPDAVEILPLTDGTTVLLPKALRGVLRKLARIMTSREESAMRFARSEALLVDALLESADRRRDDAAFRSLRARLATIELPTNVPVPQGFAGSLRDYQQQSLAWFAGLRELGMGGCLADEMGLGKTVQVLAMLAGEHAPTTTSKASAKVTQKKTKKKTPSATDRPGSARHPSLLVVPRSIVRNWVDEAARFAPSLRVIDCSQADRAIDDATFESADLVIVTYGTLLRDIETLAKRDFHYVILDEAQAIKNEAARTTKATKCLRAQHRLVMTGTPIENHLGELWSLMDFLNPALALRLGRLAGSGEGEDLETVRKAVRPFLLRRTKREVAKELPDRIEQTMHCDMTTAQRAHYEELLKRIRTDLLKGSDAEFGRRKLDVLEGLLRLRQIACHPSLVDPARAKAGSGKLEALLPMLEESAEEGRKTLVFSQFTSFLAIVRAELDARSITYEYLDGQTRDRPARVRRFIEDERCTTFLLSLKAGGVGLNLQCAERVVLLDPWWNPAVEAQAIDRTHRIGQKKSVHAIRLVSAGTVEDRVLDLQARKRSLADAIVGGDAGPLASMTREDLAFLLHTG